MRMGIDVGGTFTDLVLIDDASGRMCYAKELTTPEDLAQGVLRGVERLLSMAGASMADVSYLAHGTTIGTNALIERRGAKVGLITSRGFGDVLEIARIERPDEGLYDINVDLPDPLVPRYLRREVDERVGADGQVVRELDIDSAYMAAGELKQSGVESLAICLLFSFCNPSHELRLRQICQEVMPDVPVTVSCEIAPEFREFERTSTTVLNAYLLPITSRYIDSLSAQLEAKYGPVDLRLMQASGGAMPAGAAKVQAVQMVNSGPAGGALATGLVGRLAGEDRVIGVDMGGTSFDVSLIAGGEPRLRSEGEFEGYPVKMPLIDVEGIGAGGGSIAWVDPGGALSVGPRSAGADPGPACYGLGGEQPTVTDANLVLGRLNPDYFLGGDMPLDLEAARRAISRHIAEPLGFTVEQAAVGILRVVNANMARGISVNSTQKGFDVREFALLAFGGAGPLHAVELAEDLAIPRVIVPPYCSVFSAFGVVASDLRHDYVSTLAMSEEQLEPADVAQAFAALEAEALAQLEAERVPSESIQLQRSADVRYAGQSYEITIPLPRSDAFDEDDLKGLIDEFHATHERLYAYSDRREPVELINVRLAAIGRVPQVDLTHQAPDPGSEARPKQRRPVVYPGRGQVDSAVYERDSLRLDSRVSGPCLIEERTSTTVIPPGWTARVDRAGSLIVERLSAAGMKASRQQRSPEKAEV